MSQFPVEVRTRPTWATLDGHESYVHHGHESYVHLDLGWIDGGDHSRDIRDWRNMSADEAIELGRDLIVAGLVAKTDRRDQK
jgi:hypothetical protein